MCSEKVCEGHLLCKVSHSQLLQVQRKPRFDIKINKVKGTGSRCTLEGHVKDNYYASFHTLPAITEAEKTKLRHEN